MSTTGDSPGVAEAPSNTFSMKNSCCWRVEVTIQSLSGLVVVDADEEEEIRATVTVGGSVTQMQVLSSTICHHSGNLLLESLPLDIDDSSGTSCVPATAQWQPPAKQPHVVISMPERDSKLPNRPLSITNRGSTVIKEDEEENSPPVGDTTSSTWSNTGSLLPEIIELSIRFNTTPSPVGIAHLVMLGHEQGSFVLDLPLKQQSSTADTDVRLTSASRIRVRVCVIPPSCTAKRQWSSTTLSTAASTISNASSMRRSLDSVKESPRPPGRAINIEIPENHAQQQQRPMFCGAWSGIVEALAHVRCDTGSTTGIFHDDLSVGSTIMTRESMDL